MESGVQFLTRLTTRTSIKGVEPLLFGGNCPSPGDVCELYGYEGSGKTITLFHLITRLILPQQWKGIVLNGYEACVLYIDTTYHFSIFRLATMIEARVVEAAKNQEIVDYNTGDTDMEGFIKLVLKRLIIVHCSSSSQLLITLHSLDDFISSKPEISLMMIDSIGAFYWLDRLKGGDSRTSQELNMKRIIVMLKKLIENHKIPLVVTKTLVYQPKSHDIDEKHVKVLQAPKFLNHAEFLCSSWTKFVTHQLQFVKDENNCFHVFNHSLKSVASFTVGVSGPSFERN